MATRPTWLSNGLAVSQANDPYTVKLMVLAVDDSETRVTQSVEERDAPSQAAFEAKVAQQQRQHLPPA